jgi:hypothetical protein
MTSSRSQIVVAVSCLLLVLALGSASAKSSSAGQLVSVTVPFTGLAPGYLLGKVSKSQLSVSAGKRELDVTALTRAEGPNGGLQLAILIDGNIRQQLSGAPMDGLADLLLTILLSKFLFPSYKVAAF